MAEHILKDTHNPKLNILECDSAPRRGMSNTSSRRAGPHPSRGPGPPRALLPLMHVYMQDLDPQGPRNATTPHLEDCTPYSDDHTACWGWQDADAISARPRTISRTTAMPHSVLPTAFDHYTSAIRGKTTNSTSPYPCTPPLLVTIKGGDGLPLRRGHSRSSSHIRHH